MTMSKPSASILRMRESKSTLRSTYEQIAGVIHRSVYLDAKEGNASGISVQYTGFSGGQDRL